MRKHTQAAGEPELADVLNDPIMAKLMESDGISPETVLSLVRKLREERDNATRGK